MSTLVPNVFLMSYNDSRRSLRCAQKYVFYSCGIQPTCWFHIISQIECKTQMLNNMGDTKTFKMEIMVWNYHITSFEWMNKHNHTHIKSHAKNRSNCSPPWCHLIWASSSSSSQTTWMYTICKMEKNSAEQQPNNLTSYFRYDECFMIHEGKHSFSKQSQNTK